MNVEAVQHQLNEIALKRGWVDHHKPRNLILAMVREVGELAELYQWSPPEDWPDLDRVGEELADIQIYLLRLFSVTGIDWAQAVEGKMAENERRWAEP